MQDRVFSAPKMQESTLKESLQEYEFQGHSQNIPPVKMRAQSQGKFNSSKNRNGHSLSNKESDAVVIKNGACSNIIDMSLKKQMTPSIFDNPDMPKSPLSPSYNVIGGTK